ncbi:hypothetical protein BGW37DRAFT_471500 [Umbelopsis sp. PMI_123]|nr:hypothetical protein BGW37DRAFT_471500 [Umbelopsis sp. PMI_123]
MPMPLLLALVAAFIGIVNAGGSIPPQYTFGGMESPSIIPASWSLTNQGSLVTSNSCVIIISPAFGGVYQAGSSLAIRWFLNSDASTGPAQVNSTYQLTISLVDNYSNHTTVIASGVDPYSSVYLWEIPSYTAFNRRLYVVVSGLFGNVTASNAAVCDDSPQIAGPFTILSRPQPSFFITGPDPGIGQNNTDLGFRNGTGIGLLQSVPMGRLFYNVAIPIAWFCTINNINLVDIYLVADESGYNATMAQSLNVNSARYYYTVPSTANLPKNTTYSILMYGRSSNSSNILSWGRDGPYNITTAS